MNDTIQVFRKKIVKPKALGVKTVIYLEKKKRFYSPKKRC